MSEPSAASSRPAVLRLSVACELSELRVAAQSVRGFLAAEGWPSSDLTSFDLVLAEACSNAAKYADERGRARPVFLEVFSDSASVELRVRDHTPGFDWPGRISLPPPESESGRGLYLISNLMDSAEYFRGRGENILVLRKARSPQPPAPGTAMPRAAEDTVRRLAENEAVIGELVEELSSCYESLAAIFRYSAEQGRAVEPREFAGRILRDLLLIVEAGWFVLRVAPESGSPLVVLAASEPALELDPLSFPAPGLATESVELTAALGRRCVWFDPARPLNGRGPVLDVKRDSAGVVHPILLGDRLVGTLALGKPARPHHSPAESDLAFTAAQMSVINTFADFLAIQIVNASFLETQLRQRLIAHELEIANNIQRSLLAGSLPQIHGVTLSGLCRNAREVGGDFYDVLRVGDNGLLLIIADVMGKGIPAALFAASLRTLLRASPELTRQPGALLGRVNRLLFAELSGVEMFITAQLAFVDAGSRQMVVASAGHCPLLLADKSGVRAFAPEGMPLGVMAETTFGEATVQLQPGCAALLYTDGLTEARNATGEQFGEQRLKDWLGRAAMAGRSPSWMKDELARELEQHRANTALSDDQAFLIMTG
jgi:serine phosphatase RsbU (regulator of sigma subunit)/anti-sigma regulatory factor (Ser/Thr protein kinase)